MPVYGPATASHCCSGQELHQEMVSYKPFRGGPALMLQSIAMLQISIALELQVIN